MSFLGGADIGSFLGLRIVENVHLVVGPFEDWSKVRSPGRARRWRAKHRQNIRLFYKPDPSVYRMSDGIFAHPTICARLRAAIPPKPRNDLADAIAYGQWLDATWVERAHRIDELEFRRLHLCDWPRPFLPLRTSTSWQPSKSSAASGTLAFPPPMPPHGIGCLGTDLLR